MKFVKLTRLYTNKELLTVKKTKQTNPLVADGAIVKPATIIKTN